MNPPDYDSAISGVRVGLVTDNDDPEGMGRVKLRFPWRDADDESPWARIAAPMAGDDYGAYFLPEVETEVLVAFADGDIHRPYVVGALWNGSAGPPHGNEDGTNDVRAVETPGGNRILVDDSPADGRVLIETDAGHRVSLGPERIAVEDGSGTNSVELDAAADTVSVTAGSKIELAAQTVEIRGEETVSVEGGRQLALDSDAAIDLASGGRLRATSSGVMNLNASGPLTASGSLIKLN